MIELSSDYPARISHKLLPKHASRRVGKRQTESPGHLRLFTVLLAVAVSVSAATWRPATESELRKLIPARAPVESEHIETEFRTASAVTDGRGSFIGGVVLITAGYAAEGKYSNFLIAQTPIKVGDVSLARGEYVFGWRRNGEDSLMVKFYEAHSGKPLGAVEAKRLSRVGRIESFHISPPGEKAFIQIGRFGMSYSLAE